MKKLYEIVSVKWNVLKEDWVNYEKKLIDNFFKNIYPVLPMWVKEWWKKVPNPLNKRKKIERKYKILTDKWDPYYYKYIVRNKRRHLFHIVDESPWPLIMACSLFLFFFGFIMYCHLNKNSGIFIFGGLFLCIYTLINWWRDIIREATFLGHHTRIVQKMIMIGMKFFILTEVMFFFGFFWGFFHSSLVVNFNIGSVWPPLGLNAPVHRGIAIINTIILISSGITLTWAHRSVRRNVRWEARLGFLWTLIYACMFLKFQFYEYFNLLISMEDGIVGSTFYMLTGLHCLHVIVGAIFIFICYLRFEFFHFKKDHHVGLICAVWYWHFVDIVWICLFFMLYWWGGWVVNTNIVGYIHALNGAFV